MKILCIDDNHVNRILISKQLDSMLINHVMAASARDGVLRLLQDPEVTAILLDLMMPGVDGFGASMAIRNLGFKIPIIALTSLHDSLDIQLESMQKGIDEYIQRPCKPSYLVSVLKRLHPNEQFEPIEVKGEVL